MPLPIEKEMTLIDALFNAVQVLRLTPHIRDYLADADPKALEQADIAAITVGAYLPNFGEGVPEMHLYRETEQ
jgi:hypothetical protein